MSAMRAAPGRSHRLRAVPKRDHILGVRERHLEHELERGDEALRSSGRKCSGPPRKATLPGWDFTQASPPMVCSTGLKDGAARSSVRPPREQRDHVGLGEYPAAGSDGVQGRVVRVARSAEASVWARRHRSIKRPGAAAQASFMSQIRTWRGRGSWRLRRQQVTARHVGLQGQTRRWPGGNHDFLHERQPENFRAQRDAEPVIAARKPKPLPGLARQKRRATFISV